MVIDTETLKPLHELTEEGKITYSDFLERKADEILFKKSHPIRFYAGKIKELLQEM